MVPWPELAAGWAAAGVLALRIDERGVAGSEGGPCSELDFDRVGRSPGYHRQLDVLDLAGAWARSRARRVIVLRGEHDWVVEG